MILTSASAFHPLDWTVLAAYMLLVIGLGVFLGRKPARSRLIRSLRMPQDKLGGVSLQGQPNQRRKVTIID